MCGRVSGIKGCPRRCGGFTLVEIFLIVVLLGVLAGLAIPTYQLTIVKAIMHEGEETLRAVRGAQLRYNLYNGMYTGNIGDLDTDFQATQNFLQPAAINDVGGIIATITQISGLRTLSINIGGQITCAGPDCSKLGY